ncbi:MAG TPA: IPT/TIG domain-containing protein [Acidobacteriota bacterium]
MKKVIWFSLAFLFLLRSSPAMAASLEEITILQAQTTATISGISPSSTGAGGPTFTLTVTGANFTSNSVVRWNGAARTTSFVSATQLTATIPASDIATPGTASVTVANADGSGVSNAVQFTITTETTLFFAQLAEGKIATGTFKTKLLVINPNNKVVTATVDFFTDTGDPFPVDIGLGNPTASFPINIPAKSEIVITTGGTRSTASPGWARVKSADRIGGLVVYQFFNASGAFVTEAGVAAAPLVRKFVIPADFSGSFESALALVNPSDTLTASVTLHLLDAGGREIATANRLFGPRQHKAEFLRGEIFPAGLIPAGFQGTVEIESTPGSPVAAVTLRTLNGLQTSSLPVVAEPEGQ